MGFHVGKYTPFGKPWVSVMGFRENGDGWDDPWIQAVGSLFLGERLRQWTPVTWPKKKSDMDKIPGIG